MKRFAHILLATLFALSCASLPARPDHIKITFTGDIIMHNAVKYCALEHNRLDDQNRSINNHGFDYPFQHISRFFRDSDIVVGNMEFPITHPFTSAKLIFNCYPQVLPAMKQAGFSMVTFANNHVFDFGTRGVVDTLSYLRTYGIDAIGVNSNEQFARAGKVIEIQGVRIGFIAYAGFTNYGFPRSDKFFINKLYDKKRVKEDIARLRGLCDYIVLVSHAGEEYRAVPEKIDIAVYREYLDSGADCVIGHHPHVLQYIEKYVSKDKRNCHIFYSLGNLISNQRFSYYSSRHKAQFTTRESILVNLYLKKRENRVTDRFEIIPVWTLNEYRPEISRSYNRIQTISIRERIYELLVDLVNAKNEREQKAIEESIRYLKERIEVMKKVLYFNQRLDEVPFLE